MKSTALSAELRRTPPRGAVPPIAVALQPLRATARAARPAVRQRNAPARSPIFRRAPRIGTALRRTWQKRIMRKYLGAAIALVILFMAYWAWALVGAAELAALASQGDAAAVMQRVDLPSLRHSLSKQIARAYLEQNPKFQKMGPLEQGFVGGVGGGVADALLREVLTPETIAALLNKGRAAAAGAGDAAGTLWRMPPLSEAFRAGPLQALANSSFDGPLSFVVALDGGDGRYGVHLHLSGTTWRLSGLDVPADVSDRLAREIAEREKAAG